MVKSKQHVSSVRKLRVEKWRGGTALEDARIVELYWERDEAAIAESSAKYGGYCYQIAFRILALREDAEECVGDTWLRAWEAMPPSRPGRLDTFLGKITRNLSLDRWRALRAQKRWQGQAELALTELGDCLPACPTGAITFEEREAPAYDHAAVLAAKAARAADTPLPCGCPGSQSRAIRRPEAAPTAGDIPSELRQWPVQIKLAPVNAPYFDGCDLLIAADCTAYAYGAFHRDFIRGRVTLIGCPKLDEGDYSEKLTAILAQNDIRSVTVVRMAVPCCGGIQRAAERAVSASGKPLSLHTVIVGTDGTLLRQA